LNKITDVYMWFDGDLQKILLIKLLSSLHLYKPATSHKKPNQKIISPQRVKTKLLKTISMWMKQQNWHNNLNFLTGIIII